MLDTDYLQPPKLLRLKSGEDHLLEEQAAAWLARSREGVTALSEKRDWLSEDQLRLRAQREILNSTGIADESLFLGMFRRAHNELAGHRPKACRYDEG